MSIFELEWLKAKEVKWKTIAIKESVWAKEDITIEVITTM